MSINHEKYTLIIVDEYSRYTWVYFLRKKSQAPEVIMSFIKMVENKNDVKVKQIKTDNGTRKNRTLNEAARTMLNGSVLSKHFWTEAVRVACYTQNRSIIVKIHDKTPYEIFRERIPDISYFHVFRCPMFIHNNKDHLGKFDAKTNDGYFLGYSFVSKAFRVFNKRRQQVEETYHVTFDESMETIRQYQVDYDVSYYIIPYGCSLTELTQENYVPEAIAHNEPEIPHTKDTKGSRSITEPLVPDVTQSHISNKASPSSYPAPHDRWSRDQHIKLVNIIGNLGEGMLTRSMATKISAASASECLFAYFLFEIEPKKGEPTYFLRLQIKQDDNGISICQEQYTKNLLKKYEISDSSSVKTPMVPSNNLSLDLAGKLVNETSYSGMIGSLMYLTVTRPDIQFSTVLYVRYQSNLNESHLTAMKRILRDHILKGDIELHFIPTKYQLADIFTKPLDEPIFTRLKAKLGLKTFHLLHRRDLKLIELLLDILVLSTTSSGG
nr:retrovirus-related Pol polyprotein from transposon TNT 1-94 [Tanacetum cinerariifolium]